MSEGPPRPPAEHHQDPISWLVDAVASVLFDVDEDVDEHVDDRSAIRHQGSKGPC